MPKNGRLAKLALVNVPFRFAICNELFQNMPLSEGCAAAQGLGYSGIELAPFTLADDPATLDAPKRREIRSTISDHNLTFVGLHWLLAAPAGLHITTPNLAVRRRSWDYVRRLIDLCADLAGSRRSDNGILVFGSPKQRSTVDGIDRMAAADVFADELAGVAPHAEQRGVQLLVEALPFAQSDVVNSLAEAAAIVDRIGSPAVQTMFDVHNAVDEKMPHSDLIRKYFRYIRHIHVNELDGREPGTGDYDFAALLETLAALNYSGWVSLEAFDFSRDARAIAAHAMARLQSALPAAAIAKTI
ncbi:MAG: sugar phosphate isomerase/epimerase [Acidobacteriaceae bacterium]|nr:sugar phosphate isomerase/epimerase [Acidobacteriaceae bacterium]